MRRLDLPPLWLLLFALAAAAVAALEPEPWGFGRPRGAGWALLAGAAALVAAAVREMARARTAVMPRREASALVTTGVFAWSRNPIYLGFAVALAGVALLLDAPAALPLVPGYALLVGRRFVRGEEAGLARAFGPAFDAWAARTRRWL